jgi:hypothetical protein
MCAQPEDPIDRGWREAKEREDAGCPEHPIVVFATWFGPDKVPLSEDEAKDYAHLFENPCEYCTLEILSLWRRNHGRAEWLSIALTLHKAKADSAFGVAIRRYMERDERAAEYIKKHSSISI